MKKVLFILVAIAGVASVHAQEGKSKSLEPGKSLTVQEANQLNGNAQPVMKNGKPYAQWVAEEKAKKKAEPAPAAVSEQQMVSINAAAAKPAPAKPQVIGAKPYSGYKEPAPDNKKVVVTEEALVKAEQPAAPRPATDALLNHFGTGQVIEAPKPAASEPGSFQAAVANKQVITPAKAVTPSRSAAEIENAKQQQQQTAGAKVAKDKEAAAASSTVPELKVETTTDAPAPAAPAAKPPVAPPAGKQE